MPTLVENIAELETKENTLINNKVSNFCYEQYAYEHDIADGVTDYEFERVNNIPVDTPSIIKLNDTVVNKGFRSQASSLPRMAMNHFLGRVSYNLNKTVDVVKGFITLIKNAIGTAGGLATLDSETKVPLNQLHKAEANGLATLNDNGKVDTTQLYGTIFSPVLGKYWKKVSVITGRGTTGTTTVLRAGNAIFERYDSTSDGGLFRSLDKGETWTEIFASDVSSDYDEFASTIVKLKNRVFIALYNSSSSTVAMFSTKDGINWEQVTDIPVRTLSNNDRIQDSIETTKIGILCTKYGLYYTEDGVHFSVATYPQQVAGGSIEYTPLDDATVNRITYNGTYFYAVVDGSIMYSTDGKVWNFTGSAPFTFSDSSYKDFLVSPTKTPDSLFACKYVHTGNVVLYESTDKGATWTSVSTSGLTGYTYVNSVLCENLQAICTTRGVYAFSGTALFNSTYSLEGISSNGVNILSYNNSSEGITDTMKCYIQSSNITHIDGQNPFNGLFTCRTEGEPQYSGSNQNHTYVSGSYRVKYYNGIWLAMSCALNSIPANKFLYSYDGCIWFPAQVTDWNQVSTLNSQVQIYPLGDIILAQRGSYWYRSSMEDLIDLGYIQ